jgi:hypothetical protein
LGDPERIEEYGIGTQIDSVQEAVVRAGKDAVAVEDEEFSTRKILEEGAGPQRLKRLEGDITTSFRLPSLDESPRAELQGNKVVPSDARIQEPLNEERAAEAEETIRNEPAIGTHEQTVEPIEEPENPIQEGLGKNLLLGPQPFELKNDSDASAVETELEQNISSLIRTNRPISNML